MAPIAPTHAISRGWRGSRARSPIRKHPPSTMPISAPTNEGPLDGRDERLERRRRRGRRRPRRGRVAGLEHERRHPREPQHELRRGTDGDEPTRAPGRRVAVTTRQPEQRGGGGQQVDRPVVGVEHRCRDERDRGEATGAWPLQRSCDERQSDHDLQHDEREQAGVRGVTDGERVRRQQHGRDRGEGRAPATSHRNGEHDERRGRQQRREQSHGIVAIAHQPHPPVQQHVVEGRGAILTQRAGDRVQRRGREGERLRLVEPDRGTRPEPQQHAGGAASDDQRRDREAATRSWWAADRARRRRPVGRRGRHQGSPRDRIVLSTRSATRAGCWLRSRSRSSVEGSTVARGQVRLIGVATGCGAAALAMPIGAIDDPSSGSVVGAIIAGLVAAAVALGAAGRRARGWALVAPPVALVAAVLLEVSAPGFIVVVIAVLAGFAAGLAAPRPWRPPGAVVGGAAGTAWALGVAVAAVVIATLTTLATATVRARARGGWIVPVAAVVAALVLVAWTGANDPQLTWFGPTISHGPRDR